MAIRLDRLASLERLLSRRVQQLLVLRHDLRLPSSLLPRAPHHLETKLEVQHNDAQVAQSLPLARPEEASRSGADEGSQGALLRAFLGDTTTNCPPDYRTIHGVCLGSNCRCGAPGTR